MEFMLGLHLEYHPWVRGYQRGDMSVAFARAHKLAAPLGTPYPIAYVVDDAPHDYLPDYVGTLVDGGLLVAEAGRADEKARGPALAKADAARRWTRLKGGAYWLGTEETLAPRRHQNLVFLHARRRAFPTFAEIAPEILALWRAGAGIPVAELVARFSHRWSEAEVEAAAWKIAGDAAAVGHLVVDLVAESLDLSTPIALLHPDESPILPEPLPDTLDRSSVDAEAPIHTSNTWPGMQEHDDSPLVTQDVPGPTVDASAITPDDARAAFLRNLAAVTDIAQGRPLRAAAADHGIDHGHLCRLVRRAREHGQPALVPYRSYHRDRALRPEFRDLIRKLYARPLRPSVTAVHEDVALKRLADELTTRDGRLARLPSYAQVYRYIRSIDDEPAVATARSGLAHPPQPRTSPTSFVRSIAAPALLCQVDDHHLDIVVVARDGTPITRRVWGAVLVCVKTAAILGAVLSLDVLREEDYMRLVKQALEPKESLVALYACQHAWPCSAKPSVIFHDRGKIFTSERAAQVLVDRLGIVTEQAPPYAPTAKGTVEALFTWVTRKFAHRLPGTTKSNPGARGAYDSAAEARAAGITLDVLEELFIRAIVDGYMREWDKLRGQTRIRLWEEAVQACGVPRWLGAPDDLTLLLMKAVNRRNPATGRYAIHPGHGLSFLGRWYVSPGLLDRLRGKELDIYYDRRDISVIYLYLDGAHVGEAYCAELAGRRVSAWEADATRKATAPLARAAAEESLGARQAIQEAAQGGRAAQRRETVRLERARQLDLQRGEIHPATVQATLQAIAASQGQGRQEEPDAPPADGLAPAVPDDKVIPLRRPAIRARSVAHD